MKRIHLTLTLCGVIGATAIAAPGPASAGYYTNCGQYGIKGDVLAHNVGCSKAKGLIKSFLVKAQTEGYELTIQGFSCEGKISGSLFNITCSKGSRRVHWKGAVS